MNKTLTFQFELSQGKEIYQSGPSRYYVTLYDNRETQLSKPIILPSRIFRLCLLMFVVGKTFHACGSHLLCAVGIKYETRKNMGTGEKIVSYLRFVNKVTEGMLSNFVFHLKINLNRR
jgi:hypothetical protein